jgi:glycosyltransferase involved in cell wall biosynthesis
MDVGARSPRSGCRLLYVGRLLDWKGVDLALRAVSKFKQSQPEVRFTIVGDGPASTHLQRLTEELGLSEVVKWVPSVAQNKLEKYYRAADLFLFPSLRDSGGMAVLEAMAHRLPVICTDLGGPGIIVNKSCGRVVSARHNSREQIVSGLVEALREIAPKPTLYSSLAVGASARARQFEFSKLVASIHRPVDCQVLPPSHEYTVLARVAG